jgi:hypothetical protein
MVPERYQDAVRHGLSFFECKLEGRNYYGCSIFGTYDVKVTEEEEVVHIANRTRTRFNVNWLTGRHAVANFEVTDLKRGYCAAFIVDDPFWHNRVMINGAPPYEVIAYHTPRGIYPGFDIQSELDCLKEIMYDKVFYVVIKDGYLVKNCQGNKKEAMELLFQNPGSRLRVATNSEYKEEVSMMVARNGGLEFGWTDCEEFKRTIRPKALALIKQLKDRATPGNTQQPVTKEQVLSIMRGLSKNERKEILDAADQAPAAEDEGSAKKTTAPAGSVTALRERAAELGIPGAENMTKDLLKKAIEAAEKSLAAKPKTKTAPKAPVGSEEETVT